MSDTNQESKLMEVPADKLEPLQKMQQEILQAQQELKPLADAARIKELEVIARQNQFKAEVLSTYLDLGLKRSDEFDIKTGLITYNS